MSAKRRWLPVAMSFFLLFSLRPPQSGVTRERILRVIAQLNYSPSAWARRMRQAGSETEIEFEGVSLEDALATAPEEIHMLICSAVANGTLNQEKAIWLLEGLEKNFLADGCFGHLPVPQRENVGKVALLLAILTVK